MNQFITSPAAKLDITGIWTYFAEEIGNVELADRFAECAENAFSDPLSHSWHGASAPLSEKLTS